MRINLYTVGLFPARPGAPHGTMCVYLDVCEMTGFRTRKRSIFWSDGTESHEELGAG